MTKRERKYIKRRKPIRGFGFSQIIYAAPKPSYDCEPLEKSFDDEPDYFKNFAMLIPRRAIYSPSKKEMKKMWYSGIRHPIFKNKPWQRLNISWVVSEEVEAKKVFLQNEVNVIMAGHPTTIKQNKKYDNIF